MTTIAEQEPACPECSATVLYECVACSSNNYPPPQRTEQEPVAWLCTPDENGLFGLPLSDKGCIDCFPVYRHPPQRTWVDLTDTQIEQVYFDVVQEHRGAPMPWGQVQFGKALLDKFKEANT